MKKKCLLLFKYPLFWNKYAINKFLKFYDTEYLYISNFKNKNFLLKPGLISSLFLIFYSIFRFSIEFLRVPDEQLGYLLFNLTMGQILSVILTLAGLVLFYFKNEDKQIN